MKNSEFYDFGSKLSDSTIQVSATELDRTQDPTGKKIFDSHRLTNGDYGSLHFPIIFKEVDGKKWEDLLDTGYISLFLISDRLKTVLEENQLTGWKTYSIKLFDKKCNAVSDYHGFSIIGRSGPTEYSKDTIIQKNFYENGPVWNSYKGCHIDTDQWDGSDFFMPEEDLGIIVTARTASILKKNKITNVSLKNLADVEIEESTLKMVEEKRALKNSKPSKDQNI